MSEGIAKRWIVRVRNVPIRFPRKGVPILFSLARSDGEATGFASQEEAVAELQRRGIEPGRTGSRIAIVEVLAPGEPSAQMRDGTPYGEAAK